MNAPIPFTVRAVAAEDRGGWDRLYQGYAQFYGVTQTPEMRDRVWGWLHDPAASTEGLVAVGPDGALLGLAHYRAFARPLSATTGGFLDDLFTDPAARGQGVAEALVRAVRDVGHARGWSVLRWITARDNATARKLYDRIAVETPWVTYDIRL